ncbi:MAG: pyrroline-5-carboxylate reductase [Pseudomonadota bacterium]
MTDGVSVGLIGAGAMGGALLRAWFACDAIDAARSAVFDPAIRDDLAAAAQARGVAVNPALEDVSVDIVFVAVKPQAADEALPAYAALAEGGVVASAMAGVSTAHLARLFPSASAIARMMPNLAAAVGASASALFVPPDATVETKSALIRLAEAVGEAVSVDSEEAIDWATAIAGSGPAYFFLMVEALSEAGEALGLSEKDAARLARATASGAGALLARDSRPAADLRKAVTSPGGTTEAALKVLDGDAHEIRRIIERAARAAAERARELTH